MAASRSPRLLWLRASARHGLHWWELDLTYDLIRLLGLVNLATQINVPGNTFRQEVMRGRPIEDGSESTQAHGSGADRQPERAGSRRTSTMNPLPRMPAADPEIRVPAARSFPKGTTSMTNKFRVVARQSYLDQGMPRVGREVIGLYSTRQEAEEACGAFVQSQGDHFRPAYDDCIVELILESAAEE